VIDVDAQACIGCQACLQGCPYDALYINESKGTAEKCHFCVHRTERGLAPACAVVCPTEAIVPGDFHDPQSVVSKLRAEGHLTARKVEAGTGPNVLYREVAQSGLDPLQTNASGGYLWAAQREGDWLDAERFRAADPASATEARTTYDVDRSSPFAKAAGMDPLSYMRRYGAFEIPYAGQRRYEAPRNEHGSTEPTGFQTPSGKLEIHSATLADWGWGEHATPGYISSHVHWRELDAAAGEMVLLPTFRLPTLIHTRSANSKWLQEISHTNPLWMHPRDAERLGVSVGELVRVRTTIGYFVPRLWVTEGIHPGVVACSHHAGRWHLHREVGSERLASALVDIKREGSTFFVRQKQGVEPFESDDPDTSRIWWKEIGVNQNLTFPVQPDPVSGEDRFGDIRVDTEKSRRVYREWLALTRPAPGPDRLRRPRWLHRPTRPSDETYRL